MARAAQMRAHRGPENWARISGGMRGERLSWAVAFLKMPWRDYCSFLPKGLGRQQLGLLLIGRLLGSELGPRWVLECVCQMLCDMARVLELRLILRQPSPLWLSFTVEELQIYQQGPKVSDWLRALGQLFPQEAPSYGWQSWGWGRCGWVKMMTLRRRPSWKLARWECWKITMRGKAMSSYPLTFGAIHLFQSWSIQVLGDTSNSLCSWGLLLHSRRA